MTIQAAVSPTETGRRKKPARKASLSKRLIESLRPAETGGARTVVHDTAVPGLCAVAGATSTSFYLYRRINGRPVRFRLGGFPELTVEQARKLAQKHLGEIAAGQD